MKARRASFGRETANEHDCRSPVSYTHLCVDDRRRAAALTDDCIISHVNLQKVNFQAITMFIIVQSHGAFKYFRSKFCIFSVRDCQMV